MLTKPLAELEEWKSEQDHLLSGVVVFRKSLELQETTGYVHSCFQSWLGDSQENTQRQM